MSDEISVELISGEQGIRFAGPDLLYYEFLIRVKGGELDDNRIRIHSNFFPCCSVLEVQAESLDERGRMWLNGYQGCEKHQHKPIGDKAVRDIIWGLSEYYSIRKIIFE